jgi:serine/threonine-protein kinase HipA
MRKAIIKYNNIQAGILSELETGEYEFLYDENYIQNYPELFITFQIPVSKTKYKSKRLFPFFDGLIPEGWLLNIASESWKINKNDRMGLLLACCKNSIGAVSVHPVKENEDE